MFNNSIKKVFGILNENKFSQKIISNCLIKNKSAFSFSNVNNFYKTNTFKFSSENTNSGKTTIELIKILRAETSKNFLINFSDSPLNHIKKALQESNNNIEEAKVWLKKKGFKDAENKMSK